MTCGWMKAVSGICLDGDRTGKETLVFWGCGKDTHGGIDRVTCDVLYAQGLNVHLIPRETPISALSVAIPMKSSRWRS